MPPRPLSSPLFFFVIAFSPSLLSLILICGIVSSLFSPSSRLSCTSLWPCILPLFSSPLYSFVVLHSRPCSCSLFFPSPLHTFGWFPSFSPTLLVCYFPPSHSHFLFVISFLFFCPPYIVFDPFPHTFVFASISGFLCVFLMSYSCTFLFLVSCSLVCHLFCVSFPSPFLSSDFSFTFLLF